MPAKQARRSIQSWSRLRRLGYCCDWAQWRFEQLHRPIRSRCAQGDEQYKANNQRPAFHCFPLASATEYIIEQGVEKRRGRLQNKAREGEVGLAGMGGLPTNSQAEFTHK
jgi:hypothetical protein